MEEHLMDKTSTLALIVAVIAIIGVVVVAGLKASAPITVNTNPLNERNIITVTGTKELQVMPDKAELTIQIITNATTAKDASSENKILVSKVMTQIQAESVAKEDIETTNVYLNKITDWDYKTNKQIDRGYQQVTTLKITVKDLEKVGTVLDAAITGGANSVNNINFGLTTEAEARYKKEAIDDAAATAAEKAKLLADATGATLGKVTSLSENSYDYQPYYYRGATMDMMKAESAGGAPTPINPEKVSLSVSVTIGYELN